MRPPFDPFGGPGGSGHWTDKMPVLGAIAGLLAGDLIGRLVELRNRYELALALMVVGALAGFMWLKRRDRL